MGALHLPVVYLLHASGCPACEEMKPVVGAWWRENRHRARVVPVDLARAEWKAQAWEPEVTPTVIVRYPDGRLSAPLEGAVEPGDFAGWMERVLRA